MAASHGKNTVVLVGANNLSSYLNNVDYTKTADTHDVTTFTNDAKVYAPGLKDGTASLSGLFDGNPDAIDEELEAILGAASQVVTIGTEKMAVGSRCRLLQAIENEYNVSSPVADMVAVDASMQADGGIEAGVSLQPLVAVSGTGNGDAVDNLVATNNGGVAHLHVTELTGASAAIKIQHSADESVWADLLSFTPSTAPGVQRVVVNGVVNRHIRATRAGTYTSITHAVAFARR